MQHMAIAEGTMLITDWPLAHMHAVYVQDSSVYYPYAQVRLGDRVE